MELMARKNKEIGGWLNSFELRWSLWALINKSGMTVIFSLPAWAAAGAGAYKIYHQ